MKKYTKNVIIEVSFSGFLATILFAFLLDVLDIFLSLIVSIFIFCLIVFIVHLLFFEKINYDSELRSFVILPYIITFFVGFPVKFVFGLSDSSDKTLYMTITAIIGLFVYFICFFYLYKKSSFSIKSMQSKNNNINKKKMTPIRLVFVSLIIALGLQHYLNTFFLTIYEKNLARIVSIVIALIISFLPSFILLKMKSRAKLIEKEVDEYFEKKEKY